jgi:glycosyltransferase involved in cell wall biosynthesis
VQKLAIITSHPIQYNAPLFRLLTERKQIDIKVFYTWGQAKGKVYDPGFGKEREWDIPLLNGYNYEFLNNVARDPGTHHFRGIDNPDIISRIQAYNPNALLMYGWSFKSHLKTMRYFHKKIPVWFRGDSTLLDEAAGFSFKKTARQIFLRWVYRHIDYALYAGRANRQYFEALGLKDRQLVFVPHAVENDRFYDREGQYDQQAKSWRRELGIGDKEMVFLFAGKLEPKKDPELLVRAFRQLKAPDTRLIFVGNGILEEKLKAMAGTGPDIIFLPFQNQRRMPVVYRLGDVFILPSKGPGETWGLAVNEAMACSRPVMVSDKCGCAADLVLPEQNGWIFEAGSLTDLLRALQDCIQSPQQATQRGELSYQKIKHWDLTAQAIAIENLLIAH